jgi:hypothetical protein
MKRVLGYILYLSEIKQMLFATVVMVQTKIGCKINGVTTVNLIVLNGLYVSV